MSGGYACGMSTQATTYRHLAPRPESSYRQLFVKGTRIRAEILYGAHVNAEEPRTARQIAEDYRLPLDAVEEAIAYCRDDPPEMAADHAREEQVMAATGQLEPDYKYHPYPKPMPPGLLGR